MKIVIRNIAACTIGVLLGGAINMGIIIIGPMVVAPPPGVDTTTAESLAKSIHLFEAKHFMVPFLAHAVGTLIGSLSAFLIAGSYRLVISFFIGIAFLAGGVAASFMIPAPLWFIVLDLLVAYIPMAWAGAKLGARVGRVNTKESD